MAKKKIFVLALAVCLLAILSMGSLAWFHAQDSVKNEFYIADSKEHSGNELFSVDVYEYTEKSPTNKVPTGDTFDEILPGDHLKKEPHVANTGFYDQYVRVTVTISDATAWLNAVGEAFKIEDVFEGFDPNKWNHIEKKIEGKDKTDTITYVLYYTDILDGSDTANDAVSGTTDDITLFTYVNIPQSLTQDQAAAFKGGFNIDVQAEAVQTENVVPTGTAAEDAAWAAFKTVAG